MTTAAEFQAVLGDLNTVMLGDLDAMWSHAADWDAQEFRSWVLDAYPDVASPYVDAAGDLAADWYDDAAPELEFKAKPAALPPVEQMRASAGWALSNESAFELLAGSAQRMLFNGSRQTVLGAVEQEAGATWARHASGTACSFCRMLATRSNVYVSKGAAEHGKSGSRYHDNCHCLAVMVRPGCSFEPAPYVSAWEADYKAARRLAGSGDVKEIMAAYRQLGQ
ncbi:VG15 protein [Antrihabitans cavernicola]|uniref:Uncharacterized protein n=1 Tax=Antrihabitans cavernicola TaxID=2495913 RepID=A0A5A7S9H9_9NOCA|nr:hypothetical protein [Spelaeibacter cavernicola]KAA0021812.1 hypothetical protein FOY51_15525 [Spelaeibacter cavernicola]